MPYVNYGAIKYFIICNTSASFNSNSNIYNFNSWYYDLIHDMKKIIFEQVLEFGR